MSLTIPISLLIPIGVTIVIIIWFCLQKVEHGQYLPDISILFKFLVGIIGILINWLIYFILH